MRQLFGIGGSDESTVTDTNTYTSGGEGDFVSIKDLPVDHRLRYLRTFLAKVHNFQVRTTSDEQSDEQSESQRKRRLCHYTASRS